MSLINNEPSVGKSKNACGTSPYICAETVPALRAWAEKQSPEVQLAASAVLFDLNVRPIVLSTLARHVDELRALVRVHRQVQ